MNLETTPTPTPQYWGTAGRASAAPPRPRFDDVVLPHLSAAYRLARWLMRNDDDARDVVQESSLRALQYFETFTGGNARAWFLRIVRNTGLGWHSRSAYQRTERFDEGRHGGPARAADPEMLLLLTDGVALVAQALDDLPERSRALIVHRELEGLTYRELADVLDLPLGTVMSGLSRARRALRGALDRRLKTPRPRAVGGGSGPLSAPRRGAAGREVLS